MSAISVAELSLWRRGGFAHALIDVRRAEKRAAEGDEIPGGRWLDPARWLDWKDGVAADRPVVVYCAYGHEISQGPGTRSGRSRGARHEHEMLRHGLVVYDALYARCLSCREETREGAQDQSRGTRKSV